MHTTPKMFAAVIIAVNLAACVAPPEDRAGEPVQASPVETIEPADRMTESNSVRDYNDGNPYEPGSPEAMQYITDQFAADVSSMEPGLAKQWLQAAARDMQISLLEDGARLDEAKLGPPDRKLTRKDANGESCVYIYVGPNTTSSITVDKKTMEITSIVRDRNNR